MSSWNSTVCRNRSASASISRVFLKTQALVEPGMPALPLRYQDPEVHPFNFGFVQSCSHSKCDGIHCSFVLAAHTPQGGTHVPVRCFVKLWCAKLVERKGLKRFFVLKNKKNNCIEVFMIWMLSCVIVKFQIPLIFVFFSRNYQVPSLLYTTYLKVKHAIYDK